MMQLSSIVGCNLSPLNMVTVAVTPCGGVRSAESFTSLFVPENATNDRAFLLELR